MLPWIFGLTGTLGKVYIQFGSHYIVKIILSCNIKINIYNCYLMRHICAWLHFSQVQNAPVDRIHICLCIQWSPNITKPKLLPKPRTTTHNTWQHTTPGRYSLSRVKTNRTKTCFINWCLFNQKNSKWLLTNLCMLICVKYCKALILDLYIF